ncbi:MAG: serine protein kinase RIO [Nanobdellota archaeon]
MARKKSREDWKTYSNVFDKFALNNIHYLENAGYFEKISHSLPIGKEANLFLAEKNDGSKVVVKIYRLENCNFRKMINYIRSDPRFNSIKPRKRDVVLAWVQREYRNILLARNKGIRVPTPFIYKGNIIVQEFIGLDKEIAPQLKNVVFENRKEAKECYNEVINQISKLYNDAGIVHADLSEYNILYHDKKPVLIDFSQATSKDDYHAKEYLERDIRNIVNYFKKIGLNTKKEDFFNNIKMN